MRPPDVALPDAPAPRPMEVFAVRVVRRRRLIAVAWGVVALVLLPFAPRAATRLAVGSGDPENSQSLWVEQTLANRFGSPFAAPAILVIDGLAPLDSQGRAMLREVVDSLTQAPQVTRVLSYLDVRDGRFVSSSGTLLVAGLTPEAARDNDVIVSLRQITARLQTRVRARYPRAELDWTGAAAFDYDVRLAGAADAAAAERRVLPVTLVALALVFGSVIAALIPVGAGALAIGASTGAAVLISFRWPLANLLLNLVSMIGLGLGIDYALLMVTRFRSSTVSGCDSKTAAAEAGCYAVHTVFLSGTAVAIGFAPLLLVPATELRSIAVGGLLVVTISALFAITMLPGLLAVLGHRLDGGRVRRRRTDVAARRWRQWGHWVADHPLLVLVVVGAPVLALAAQARRVSTDLPSGIWLPARMESTRGALALQRMGRAGAVQTIRVIVELPPGSGATTESGWRAMLTLGRTLARSPRIARVHSLPLSTGADHPSASLLSLLPADARSSFMSRDERLALIELEPTERESSADLERYVRELRGMDAAAASGLPGTRVAVGGLPALNADYQDAIGGSVWRVILLVVCGTFTALVIGFRSLLVAVKATALNLLSVGAAIGAAVLVFQDGHGVRLLGLKGPIDGLFPPVPLIVFCIVFGLSMDYEVFLVGRVAECVRNGMPDREALVEGLAQTAGVITNAALVMILVFAGFAMGDFLIVKILGFTLATAVLIDATLVRMALGPALLRFGGALELVARRPTAAKSRLNYANETGPALPRRHAPSAAHHRDFGARASGGGWWRRHPPVAVQGSGGAIGVGLGGPIGSDRARGGHSLPCERPPGPGARRRCRRCAPRPKRHPGRVGSTGVSRWHDRPIESRTGGRPARDRRARDLFRRWAGVGNANEAGSPRSGVELRARRVGARGEIPWYAIGGITLSNVHEVLAGGATRIACVRAILDAADPAEAARGFATVLRDAASMAEAACA